MKWGKVKGGRGIGGTPTLGGNFETVTALMSLFKWGGEPVPFTMKAGQISIHTDLLLHGSNPNFSERRRCGLTLRYMPVEVRTQDPRRANGYLCRGEDPDGYWIDLPVPQGDEVPEREG